jgi:hypothetical protein
VHELRRGTKYAAAHYFRMIPANDDRPHTMHAEAEHTGRELLPEIVGRLLDRHDARRAARRQACATTPPPNARSTSATNTSPPTSDAPPSAAWKPEQVAGLILAAAGIPHG